MSGGRRWLALDADMFAKRFTDDLYQRFGWAGIAVWVAYLAACKRSPIPGRIRFLNDVQALTQMGILGWDLVDNHGEKWDLDSFWTFCGRKKQTRRTPVGRQMDVISTHWERWQDDARIQNVRERKRRWWAENRGNESSSGGLAPRSPRRADTDTDTDTDTDISPYPLTAPASDDTTSAERRGNGHQKTKDSLVELVRTCVPGTGIGAARQTVDRLRQAGVGDIVIEEAAGYAAEHGAASARYVEQVARDWMSQRDPTWQPNG